jgi:hypothetical protein
MYQTTIGWRSVLKRQYASDPSVSAADYATIAEMDIFSDIAGFATALFTAWAAWSARQATSIAKSASENSGTIAKEQTTALMTAAKANALASRISFYDQQIADLESMIAARQINPARLADAQKTVEQLKVEQRHLAYWLDRQTDALGVGLGNLDNGSGYVPRQK